MFNLTGVNMTNNNDYERSEREMFIIYNWIAFILCIIIIISNLTVVISSGLILRKGQQPKSTYLLLGNVSLADTMLGFSVIFGASIDISLVSNQMCIFYLVTQVCPGIVSIFSVGLIAVDRYIYILHGLYYQRWFTTTRVRIGIVCIWAIGVCVGFIPATGWVNQELASSFRCHYVAIYPGALLLFNSVLSTIPIISVAFLYCIILVQALKNLNNIKLAEKSVEANPANSEAAPKLRINRGNTRTPNIQSVKNLPKPISRKRSASFNTNNSNVMLQTTGFTSKYKSVDDLNIGTITEAYVNKTQMNTDRHESNFSVYTIESSYSKDSSMGDITETSSKDSNNCNLKSRIKKNLKVRGPNKWRAVTIVMLTTFSFIVTWMPFFIVVTLFVFCEEKLTNPKCLHQRGLLTGPLGKLALLNSVLNPLIYAWWHKGFKKSIKSYFRKYIQQYCFKK